MHKVVKKKLKAGLKFKVWLWGKKPLTLLILGSSMVERRTHGPRRRVIDTPLRNQTSSSIDGSCAPRLGGDIGSIPIMDSGSTEMFANIWEHGN